MFIPKQLSYTQDMQKVLSSHPLGLPLLKTAVLDQAKRNTLVEIVANFMVMSTPSDKYTCNIHLFAITEYVNEVQLKFFVIIMSP